MGSVALADIAPPWIVYSDKGKPVAILPAGRPGEVANVRGLSMAAAQTIVDAANAGWQAQQEARLAALERDLRAVERAIAAGMPAAKKKRGGPRRG